MATVAGVASSNLTIMPLMVVLAGRWEAYRLQYAIVVGLRKSGDRNIMELVAVVGTSVKEEGNRQVSSLLNLNGGLVSILV